MTKRTINVPLCIKCKWIALDVKKPEESKCSHPQLASRVTGEPMTYCSVERSHVTNNTYPCGQEGELFQEKVLS